MYVNALSMDRCFKILVPKNWRFLTQITAVCADKMVFKKKLAKIAKK
jgi:hypothetical protein